VLLDRLAEDRPEEERRLAAERAIAEVDRLAVLVDDLLALASADEHSMVLADDEVDLDDVVLSEAGVLRARGMPIVVAVEPVRVLGDAHRLGRVVRNLLENAERHREDVVRLTLSDEGEDAVLVVDNDGPPVAHEDRERIFGRFVRLDDSRTRDTGGTGLGLAIVAEIVRAHGGSVRAEESPEGWCRFSVRIPQGNRSG
jgi:signal transduction histidine kinase